MKSIIVKCTILLSIFLIGCSSTSSKWTFSNSDYELILSDAKSVKSNYDMYVEKEERGLDYSKELEENVNISNNSLDNAKNIREKYDEKLTEEETTILAELSLTYRYLRNNFDSKDETTIKRMEQLQKQILKLEEE